MSIESEQWLIPTVKNLDNFDSYDDVPNIQFHPQSITFEMAPLANAVNFADHTGYQTNFGSETEAIAQVESLIDQGQHYVHMLYTFRSVSRAIPMIQDTNATNKDQINRKTFDILRPEINKIKELMDFQEQAVRIFCSNLQHLVTPEARAKIVPEGLYNALIKVVDMLQKVDNLKDMKACLNNDFARYKRAFSSLRADLSDGDVISEEIQQLQMFLANPTHPKHLILFNLRDAVKRISGHEDVLIDVLLQCVEHLEGGIFVTPDEKYRLIRALPHLMLLIDGDDSEGSDGARSSSSSSSVGNIFRTKKIKLNAIKDLFRRFPVVPEYGDMAIQLSYILRDSTFHFDETQQLAYTPEVRESELNYDISNHWQRIRTEYTKFMTDFTYMTSMLSSVTIVKTRECISHAESVYQRILMGFRLLSQWTSRVLDTMAWKFTHPAPEEKLKAAGANMSNPHINYERAIRYNFSREELSKFVDCIFMIKSLASLLMSNESKVAPLIRMYIHHRTQMLAQAVLLPILHRVDKKKKPIMTTLLQLRNLAADWANGVEPRENYKSYKRAQGSVNADLPVRVVGPSATQLHLIRTIVRALYDERSEGRQSGFFSRADLEKEDVDKLRSFYDDSFCFPYLLNYIGTVRSISDLGDLWYREFYLELTMCVQFPIEMSLPWILTEHVILSQTQSTPMVENILYTMDVYNDAAHRALYVLNQQFLYDEIEAEVNLVFDQLIFLISDEMYTYFKNSAASCTLDKRYKDKLETMRRASQYTTVKRRYEIPMAQRHIQLLGRSIDLNFLTTQHINNKFYKDIEAAIRKFESSDLSGVMDLESVLEVLRRTHELLSQELELDSFDTLLREVNETVAPTSFRGRIGLHVLRTLVADIFPNYSYNIHTQRFVKSPLTLKPVQYESMPKNIATNLLYGQLCARAFDLMSKLNRGFVGKPHFESLLRVLSRSDLTLVMDEVMRNLQDRIQDIAAYVNALREGIPPCKLLKYIFKSSGCFGSFEVTLRPLLEFEDLKPEVFQNLREIGNTIAFVKDLSDVLDIHEMFGFTNTSSFFNIPPNADMPGSASSNASMYTPFGVGMNEFVTGVSNQMPAMIKAPFVFSTLPYVVHRVHNLYRDVGKSKSLFWTCLARVDAILDQGGFRQDWCPVSDKVLDVETSKDFCRLWSALNFLFCLQESRPDQVAAVNCEDEFGHGFPLAGCLLVYLLGQRAKFELLDFSYHVMNVAEYERQSSGSSSASQVAAVDSSIQKSCDAFLVHARVQRSLHGLIFSLFESNYQMHPPNQLMIFHPPVDDEERAAAAVRPGQDMDV